jgi:Leucine-rich repeat (LRR) protein
MKIILLSGILYLFFANVSAEKVITCEVRTSDGANDCSFHNLEIGKNDIVSIKTDPADLDVNKITTIGITSSSIYSVPSVIFTKFPNLKTFAASNQKIREIKWDTLVNGKKLEVIDLSHNELTILHANTFKGEILFFLQITNLKAFKIPPALFYTFLKIEINH